MMFGGLGNVISPTYFGEYSTGKRIADSFVKRLMLHNSDDCDCNRDIYRSDQLYEKLKKVNANKKNEYEKIKLLNDISELHDAIQLKADKCRKENPDYMLFKEFYVNFIDHQKLTEMIGNYLYGKKYYASYKELTETNKEKFARIFSKIILIGLADTLYGSCRKVCYKKWIKIPYVKIFFNDLVTQKKLNDLLDTELKKNSFKFEKIGISLNGEELKQFQEYATDIQLDTFK